MIAGKQSIKFDNNVYIKAGATVAGTKEKKGPLGCCFDVVSQDDLFGGESWEEAESRIQSLAFEKLLEKTGMMPEDIRYIYAGDLLGQLIATSFGLKTYDVPLFGLYGACSTMGESLSLAAMCVNAGFADNVAAIASSHFASAEKQFRFPLLYGNQRPMSSTWTVTGAGAYLVSNSPVITKCDGDVCRIVDNGYANVIISGITTGKIVDYGVKDSMNMGACMAPAACDAILHNFKDMGIGPDYYDCIVTGDLGTIGQRILIDMLRGYGYDIEKQHFDCGTEIYYNKEQGTNAGGSGCGCSAITLCGYILQKMKKKEWKRVLFVPTGALLSTVSFNEGNSIPGIAHAVMLEGISGSGKGVGEWTM